MSRGLDLALAIFSGVDSAILVACYSWGAGQIFAVMSLFAAAMAGWWLYKSVDG